ncbi:MAG TPA: hypothetical protein VGR25_13905 [bacterium]|nr:hypothetical protein [bacterium]
MVHALHEIHRVLIPGGLLADLRPDRRLEGGKRRRDVLARISYRRGGREIPVGVLEEGSFADDEAADRAVRRVLREGTFTLDSTETLPFRLYFRDLESAEDYLETRETAKVDAPTRRLLNLLMRRRPGGEIVLLETLRLNILRK